MNKAFYAPVAVLLGAAIVSAHAQEAAVSGTDNPALQRGALEALRTQKNEEFDQLERDCYQKFAVNDCILGVNAQRRKVMADLKPQEEVIGNAERMQRATEQLQRLEQKKRESEQRTVEVSAIDPVASDMQKIAAQKDKTEKHLQKATNNPASEPRVRTNNALSPEELVKNELAYNQKQEEANRRRAERDKRMAERDPSIQGLQTQPLN